jgi:hypothetical protein
MAVVELAGPFPFSGFGPSFRMEELSGRRRRPIGSAAQTQRAVFPHWAFTKAAYPASASESVLMR